MKIFNYIKTISPKLLSSTLISALVVSGFVAVSATPASATEPSALLEIPKSVTLTVETTNSTSSTLKAVTDVPLEQSSSSLSLYKEGSPLAISTSTSGEENTFTVPKPTSVAYEQYYVTVGALKSNLITVHSSTSGTWELSLSSSSNSFLTQDSTPTLSANINQTLSSSGFGVYFADKSTGSIFYKKNTATTASSAIPRFYTENNKEYIAYVANWNSGATNVSGLVNIKTVSNSLFVYRTPWNVQLVTDKQTFSTDDDTPFLTWTVNQRINRTDDKYSIYIANNSTGSIKNVISTSSSLTSWVATERLIYEPSVEYVAIVAGKNTTATNISQLSDVQATSNIVTINRAAWTLSLSSDKYEIIEGEDLPKLTWVTNQKVVSTANTYKVYLADKNTGEIFYNSNNLNSIGTKTRTMEIPPFSSTETEKEYIAYVAEQASVTNVSQLNDVQAISNILKIEETQWNLEIALDNSSFTTGDSSPLVSWSSNQSIYLTGYNVYIVDDLTGAIRRSLGNETTSGQIQVPRFNTGPARTLTAYIAKATVASPTNFSQLTDIQSTSNTVDIERAPWGVSISIDNPVYKTDDELPRISWSTNQPVGSGNSEYAYYLVDETTGKVLDYATGYEASNTTSSGAHFMAKNASGGTHELAGYIAEWVGFGNVPEYASELEDVQAISNIVTATRYPWEISAGITSTIFSTDSSTPKVSWGANQSIKESRFYAAYTIQVETGNIINMNDTSERSGQETIDRFYTGPARTYQVIVAEENEDATHVNDLTDVQAISNIVGTQRAQWGASLEYDITGVDESIGKKRVKFTWLTNQSIDNSQNNYDLYIFNNSTNSLVYSTEGTHVDTFGETAFSPSIDSKDTFIAYVAKTSETVTQVSDLEDIQATSEAVFPKETSVTVLYEEYEGGGNPSGADCNQQCYGDPVNSYNGEFFENTTDLSINSLVPFNFTRSYSTWRKDENRGLGKGWKHNYDMSLEGDGTTLLNSSYIKVNQENGSIVTFAKITTSSETYYIGSNNIRAKFGFNALTGKFTFERDNGYSFIFSNTGQLEQLKDRNNNTLNLIYTAGKLTQISSTSGQTLTITWSGSKIDSLSDGTRTVDYTYDSDLLSIVNLPETTGHKQYVYDPENRVKRIVQTNGGWYENFYDSENRVIKQVNPLGGETLFSYQTSHSSDTTTITLPDGTQNVERYNKLGQLTEQKLASGSSLEKEFTYEYDFTGGKSKETGPAGTLAQYTHDSNGNVTSVKDALNRVTHFTYNEFNQIVAVTDALGKTTTNTYDELGNLLTTETPEGHITEFENNSDGTTNSITSPNDVINETDKKTLFGYNNEKYLTTITQPEGATTNVVNNAIGNPLSVQSPLNKTTQYVYNNNQQVVETIAPNLESSTVEYDNAGQVIETTDSLGRETTYTYDLMGNVLTTTGVYGTSSYEYDNMQRVVKVTDVDGAEIEYEYNDIGQPVKVIDALNNESLMTYYNHGLVQSVTDALGNTTSYEYDAVGNTVKVIDDNANESIAIYDVLNRVTSTTSSNGYTETYAFDDDGNLISSTKAGIETTAYEYDANGNLVKTIHPDLSFDEKTYDSDDQLLTTKDRDGKITSYIYDDEGKVTKTIRSDLSEVEYSYTILGQLDQVSYDNWATIDTDYEYDVHGRVISETKTGNTTTYSYDSIGNMTRRGPPTGAGVEYGYDSYGTITSIAYPSGLEVEYDYDLNGNLKTVEASAEEVASYTYNAVGSITRADYGNGTFEVNEYDNLNRLTAISLNNNAGEFYKKQLELDNVGLIIGDSTTVDSAVVEDDEYSYTSVQRLENVTNTLTSNVKAYEFNTSSNLTSSPWGTNAVTANGQLTTSAQQNKSITYAHDDRGNRTNKTVANTATPNVNESVDYQWSVDDKLTEFEKTITEVNGSTTEENKTSVNYGYDANGLLISRQESASAVNYVNGVPTAGGTSVTPEEKYVWDTLAGIPALLEDKTDNFVYGNGSTPLAQVDKTTGDIEYLHSDERGSIVAASLENGDYSWYQTFDEYGYESNRLAQSGVNQVSTRFAYAGEYQDPTTGLYNLRARWYEPETGSFLNIDPALGMTGEAYSYASANPLSYTDPLGLWSWSDTGNTTAGLLDGITGFPLVSSFMNWASPGTVDLCSDIYKGSNTAGMVGSFAIPGLNTLKVAGLAVKTGFKAFISKTINFSSKTYSVVSQTAKNIKAVTKTGVDLLKTQSGKLKKSLGEKISSGQASLSNVLTGQKNSEPSDLVRVGRWMNPKEFDKMLETGRLQEGGGGATKVAYPPSPTAFRNAPKGDYYVEFDISKDIPLWNGGAENWKTIRGPNNFLAKRGKALAEMPEVFNISKLEVR